MIIVMVILTIKILLLIIIIINNALHALDSRPVAPSHKELKMLEAQNGFVQFTNNSGYANSDAV